MTRHSPAWFDRQRAHCDVVLAQLDGSITEAQAQAIHSFVSGSRKCGELDLFTAPPHPGFAPGRQPEPGRLADAVLTGIPGELHAFDSSH